MARYDHNQRARSRSDRAAPKWSAASRTGKSAPTPSRNIVEPSAQPEGEQIRRIYACCHPKLTDDAQVILLLNRVCGLGPDEIADTLFIGIETVERRLVRGDGVLKASKGPLDLDSEKIAARLDAVQRALYLVFHAGHQARSAARTDLCREAIRLVTLMLKHPPARTGPTYGLAALMCLKAARLDESRGFVPVEMRDRSHWDSELLAQGLAFLEQSARGGELADYQIEAMIAAVHASAPSADETDWNTIVTLYDSLVAMRPSAIATLHRAIAIGRQRGPERGLEEVLSISDSELLEAVPSYWSALGEFALLSGKRKEARHAFRKARELARNPFERDHYAARIAACGSSGHPTQSNHKRRV